MKAQKSIISITQEVIIHLLFWMIWIYFTLLRVKDNRWVIDDLNLISLSTFFVIISTFYLNYVVFMPRIFRKWKLSKTILLLFLGILYFIAMRYFIEEMIYPKFLSIRNYNELESIWFYMLDNLYFGIKPIILSSVIWLIIYVIRLLANHRQIIEMHKNTEIKFLKAQLNPHFLFNSLNNIYSLVYFKSDKSLPAIDQLSKLMRYSTYNSEKEWISIAEEREYIQNYMDLEVLRIGEGKMVHNQISILDNKLQIPTFTLIPFVENAFKHGEISNEKPLNIELVGTIDKLYYQVSNSVKEKQKDQQTGIGLNNLKDRLAYYFPQNYQLDYSLKDGIFTAKLQIPLCPIEK